MNSFLPNSYLQLKPLNYRHILGIRVAGTSYEDTTKRVILWILSGEYHYVCAANVHMVMEAYDSEDFRNIINKADIVTPDGMPIVLDASYSWVKGTAKGVWPNLDETYM